jgi:hypothetical protein
VQRRLDEQDREKSGQAASLAEDSHGPSDVPHVPGTQVNRPLGPEDRDDLEYTAERYREKRSVYFTDAERIALKESGVPHEHVTVWLAHYEGHRAGTFHSALDTITSSVRNEAYDIHRSTMTAGRFAFQLIAVRDLHSGNLVHLASLGGIDMTAGATAAILPVWPRLRAGATLWPPPSGLSDDAFEDFIESWAK